MARTPYREVCGLTLLLLASAPAGSLAADTVTLKTGQQLDNVRVSIERGAVVVRTQDGRRLVFAKTKVRSLRRRPVRWNAAKPAPPRTSVRTPSKKGARLSVGPRAVSVVAPAPSSERDVRGVLWLSYVFPGMGHLTNGEYTKGSLFLLGGLGAAGLAAEAAQSSARSSARFDATVSFGTPFALFLQGTPPFQELLFLPVYQRLVALRAHNQALRTRLVYLSVVGLAVYAINIIDASYPVEKWFAHGTGRSDSRAFVFFDVGLNRAQSGRRERSFVLAASWSL